MRMGLYSVTMAEIEDLLPADTPDRAVLISAAETSTTRLAGFFGEDFLCLIGLVPVTILSGTAHLWMYHTPAVDRHRVMVARHSREFVRRALVEYDLLIGYCATLTAAMWLHWLGAEFEHTSGPLRPFHIRRGAA